MRSIMRIGVYALALTCGCLPGCSKQSTTVKTPQVSSRGTSSMRFITDSPPAREGIEFQPARPVGALTLPEYPSEALQGLAGKATVTLRFVIDPEGKVTDVGDSPKACSSVGPFAAAFRAAAERAVRSWKFTPAQWQQVEPGKDLNGDGKPDYVRVVRSERVSVYMDVSFDFEPVAGQGLVRPLPSFAQMILGSDRGTLCGES